MTIDLFTVFKVLSLATGLGSIGGLTYHAARLLSVWYFLYARDCEVTVTEHPCRCHACGKETTHALQTAEDAAYRPPYAEPALLRLINTGTLDMGDTRLREAV